MRHLEVIAALLVGAGVAMGAGGCTSVVARPEAPGRAQPEPSMLDMPAESFIYEGMDVDDLRRIVGEPADIVLTPRGEVWYYDFGVAIVQGGRVTYRYVEDQEEPALGGRRDVPDETGAGGTPPAGD